MKKLFPFILLSLMFFRLSAQDITITFQAKETGTTIDSIWVTNQKTGQKVKLVGNESLTLTKTTGVDFLSSLSWNGLLYPNPCQGEAKLSFSTFPGQVVEMRVYNISGQLISSIKQYLNYGQHTFHFTFPDIGIYAVSVLKDDGPLGFKAVCLDSKVKGCGIEYIGIDIINPVKSATVGKTLGYTQGDIFLYSVFSGKNNTIITDSPTASKGYSVEFYECTDNDKKSYSIVKIGNQWWMAENLAFLPSVNPPATESFDNPCYYVSGYQGSVVSEAKKLANYNIYGVLYNWAAAGRSCPVGWHLPGNEEWTVLTNYLIDSGYNFDETTTGNKIASVLSAETHWKQGTNPGSPGYDLPGNNRSGFSALPGACRTTLSAFGVVTLDGYWWSSTESYSDAYCMHLHYGSTKSENYKSQKTWGYSVRCVRDKEPVTVFSEDFSWLNYGSAVPYNTTGETRYDKWTQEERDKGWTSTVNEVSGSGNTPMCYARVGFVKLGKTGYGGDIISPKLANLEGTKNVRVTFKAAAYVSSGGTVIDTRVLKINILGAGTASVDSMMIENVPNNKAQDDEGIVNNIWDPARAFSFTITGATAETRIQFLGKAWDLTREAVTTNRIFLDDIKVVIIE